MHSVTSNAVASQFRKVTTVTNASPYVKWVEMPSGFTDSNCFVLGKNLYYNDSSIYCEDKDIQIIITAGNINQIGIVVSNSAFYNKTIDVFLMKKTT